MNPIQCREDELEGRTVDIDPTIFARRGGARRQRLPSDFDQRLIAFFRNYWWAVGLAVCLLIAAGYYRETWAKQIAYVMEGIRPNP